MSNRIVEQQRHKVPVDKSHLILYTNIDLKELSKNKQTFANWHPIHNLGQSNVEDAQNIPAMDELSNPSGQQEH